MNDLTLLEIVEKHPMQINIRQERKEDFREVFELNAIAFEQDGEAKLVDALRKNESVFIPQLSLVATEAEKVVGHILFTKIKVVGEQIHESLALAPMAVLPEYKQKGIGGQLITEGLKIAKNLGFSSVIVLGHEHYYPKFGFEPAEKWQVKAPFEVPSSAFMGIELKENGLQNCAGTVAYPSEFEGV